MRWNERPHSSPIVILLFLFHCYVIFMFGSIAVKVRDHLVLEQSSMGKDCHLVGAGMVLGQQEEAAGSSVATGDSLAQ